MIGHLSVQSPALERAAASERRVKLANWQRRSIEAVVAVAAFAVWGQLAYSGFFRLLARAEGIVVLSGHWLLDVASLLVGVSGSIAGASALWAIGMRALGRTPSSLLGAPDDSPADAAYRTAARGPAAGARRRRPPAPGGAAAGQTPGPRTCPSGGGRERRGRPRVVSAPRSRRPPRPACPPRSSRPQPPPTTRTRRSACPCSGATWPGSRR